MAAGSDNGQEKYGLQAYDGTTNAVQTSVLNEEPKHAHNDQ